MKEKRGKDTIIVTSDTRWCVKHRAYYHKDSKCYKCALEDRIIYECGICGAYHKWSFRGDCRDDTNRYPDVEDYAAFVGLKPEDIEVRSMDERVAADTAD